MVEEFGVISVCDKDKISMSFCRSAFERKPIVWEMSRKY